MLLILDLLISLQNKYGNITSNLSFKFKCHLSWNFRIKKSSMNKVKNESLLWNNRELEQTLLSDSFIGFFFHSQRDQMNSGKNKETHTISSLRNSLCSLPSLGPTALTFMKESLWHRSLLGKVLMEKKMH